MTLTILTDPILGDTPHGFFTRMGGASSGVFKGLNCGHGSSDQSAAVTTNRRRVADAMKVDPSGLVSVYQVHSNNVVEVREPWPDNLPKVDAMVTNTPNIALGILTADCAPVLFSDPIAGVVGAAHAGWKGALAGVTDNTIQAMEKLGQPAKTSQRPLGLASVRRPTKSALNSSKILPMKTTPTPASSQMATGTGCCLICHLLS